MWDDRVMISGEEAACGSGIEDGFSLVGDLAVQINVL
jgi:hypothetical protein